MPLRKTNFAFSIPKACMSGEKLLNQLSLSSAKFCIRVEEEAERNIILSKKTKLSQIMLKIFSELLGITQIFPLYLSNPSRSK